MEAQSELGPPEEWGTDDHTEKTVPGKGLGFVRWEKIGQHLRGRIFDFWNSEFGLIANVELTADPTAAVFTKAESGKSKRVKVTKGDPVYLDLTGVDLGRKILEAMKGEEIGVQFTGTVETPKGEMKLFRVVVFQPSLPF